MIKNATDPVVFLTGIFRGVSVFLNYTGQEKCFDVDSVQTGDVDQTAWGYQVD